MQSLILRESLRYTYLPLEILRTSQTRYRQSSLTEHVKAPLARLTKGLASLSESLVILIAVVLTILIIHEIVTLDAFDLEQTRFVSI